MGVEHRSNPLVHLLLFHELGPLSLFHTFANTCAEPLVILKKPKSSVFDEFLSGDALPMSDFGKLSFLIWREIHVHGVSLGCLNASVKMI
jgi:hypothetical protein